MLFKLIGGIGLFLLGMIMLTDGLKAFAGDALRRALIRFTGTPLKAFGSGALVTAMVQSSSATTVTVIGFVSAGLLTFPQAVGVVFGASLGTTATGWIVSVLGLKVSLGFYALPLVGIGALLKLLARGRWKSLGLALAGFGLIFVGIETLQEGMESLSGIFNLSKLSTGGIGGYLLAMLIGIVMTVIMQSSSAAVATTLTALHTGAVNFEQAASLVIGAAIGTTVTGALAAIGGSVPAKRTALAHVVFNLATGLIAILLLPLLLWSIRLGQEHLGLDAGATSLAAFHTLFIGMGVALFLPFVDRFSAWIIKLLPDKGPVLTQHLDDTLLSVPAVALEATRRALSETACEMFEILGDTLKTPPSFADEHRIGQVRQSLDDIQRFFAKIPSVNADVPLSQSRVAQMHAIDHLMRLKSRLRTSSSKVHHSPANEKLQPVMTLVRNILDLGQSGLRGNAAADWLAEVEKSATTLAEMRRDKRSEVLQQTAGGDWDPAVALEILDSIRWFDRVGYHSWRICNYLSVDGKKNVALPELETDSGE
ncbi:MAG: Na/Pi cotransporter family protein [Verrucomicrobia bacterium]|nr:Na/Pi cotransporter family protein [Verrucomicrobiota bacterium]